MKILFLGIFALSIIAIINVGTIYAQYGGPVMGPSATISDVATSANNVYVTWNGEDQDTKSPAAFLKSSNDNGASFGKTINLAQYGASPHDLFRPNVNMASSENNLYLAWSDWKPNTLDSDIFFMKSSDGASTFDKPFKIKTGNGISTVVSISSSEDNVYVLMYNNTDSDYSDLLLVTSNDNGETFGKPLSISTNHKLMIGNVQMLTFKNNIYIVASGSYWGSQNGVVMLTIADEVLAFIPQVGVSGNDVYVIWTQMVERGSALFFEKSVDGGVSFGNKLQINQDGDSRWPQMIVSQNNVFVKWVQSFPSGGDKLLLSKSTDKGNTFSAPLNLGGYTAGFDFSQIGILENGNMFAVWTGEDDPSYSHSGISFRKSTDGGATFGDIYDLNVASKTAILNPKIALIQNNIYVAGDSGSAGIDDITFRASSDSGNTFTGPTNLNSDEPVQSSNPSQLVPIPQFKPDIPTGVPANSQFSNSQNASFVLGQLDFMSNSANPTASTFSAPHFVAFDSQGNLWVSLMEETTGCLSLLLHLLLANQHQWY
ncbi:MAG: exo-alpha-sialidase [Thaumarchaeota archaeon]|nr:MAG: exo-alpha-sialidase [Nitrososphaerota archaeon]